MWGPRLVFRAARWKCPGITAWFRVDSGTNQFKAGKYVVGIGILTHFYCLAVEAGFYSDVVECLPLDPAAQVRFPPRAVGIFLHPVTLIYTEGHLKVIGFKIYRINLLSCANGPELPRVICHKLVFFSTVQPAAVAQLPNFCYGV